MQYQDRIDLLTLNLLELFGDSAIDAIADAVAETLRVEDGLDQLDKCRRMLQKQGYKTARDITSGLSEENTDSILYDGSMSTYIEEIYEKLAGNVSNREAVDATDALFKVIDNIVQSPRSERSRCLNLASTGFQQRLIPRIGAELLERFLQSLGFLKADDLFILPAPESSEELEVQLQHLKNTLMLLGRIKGRLNSDSKPHIASIIPQNDLQNGQELKQQLELQLSDSPVHMESDAPHEYNKEEKPEEEGGSPQSQRETLEETNPHKKMLPGMDNPGPKAGRVMDMTVRAQALEKMQNALQRRAQVLASKSQSLSNREAKGDWTKSKGIVAGTGTVVPGQKARLGSKRFPAQQPDLKTSHNQTQKRIMTIADLRRDNDSDDDEVGDRVGRRQNVRNTDSWGSMEIPSHYSAKLGGGGSSLLPNASAPANESPDVARFRKLGIEMLQLTNEHRRKHKLPPLVWDEQAAIVAAQHSRAMALGQVAFGHSGFGKRTKEYEKRINGRSSMSAENVAYASHNIDEYSRVIVTGWVNSPGHNKNLLSRTTRCGIGVYQGKDGLTYSTQLFFTP